MYRRRLTIDGRRLGREDVRSDYRRVKIEMKSKVGLAKHKKFDKLYN